MKKIFVFTVIIMSFLSTGCVNKDLCNHFGFVIGTYKWHEVPNLKDMNDSIEYYNLKDREGKCMDEVRSNKTYDDKIVLYKLSASDSIPVESRHITIDIKEAPKKSYAREKLINSIQHVKNLNILYKVFGNKSIKSVKQSFKDANLECKDINDNMTMCEYLFVRKDSSSCFGCELRSKGYNTYEIYFTTKKGNIFDINKTKINYCYTSIYKGNKNRCEKNTIEKFNKAGL